jgi:hypothetical protein
MEPPSRSSATRPGSFSSRAKELRPSESAVSDGLRAEEHMSLTQGSTRASVASGQVLRACALAAPCGVKVREAASHPTCGRAPERTRERTGRPDCARAGLCRARAQEAAVSPRASNPRQHGARPKSRSRRAEFRFRRARPQVSRATPQGVPASPAVRRGTTRRAAAPPAPARAPIRRLRRQRSPSRRSRRRS